MNHLRWERVDCLPLVHGRLAFALAARRKLLEESFDAVAVELPPSLQPEVLRALGDLPAVSVVLYRETPDFLDPAAPAWYVPIQPADGIVEALRIAREERLPSFFVDAEIPAFQGAATALPDPHGVRMLGLEAWYRSCLPLLARHPRGPQDAIREAHMAARLRALLSRFPGRILFLCGMAHWAAIQSLLAQGGGELFPEEGPPPSQITRFRAHPRSVPFLMGEIPYVAVRFEKHRAGIDLEEFDAPGAVKQLLLEARKLHRRRFPGSLEKPGPGRLRALLDFARKMTVRRGFLIPDSYTLVAAANGAVGNDYAFAVLEQAHRYPWNGELIPGGEEKEGEGTLSDRDPPEGLPMTADRAWIDGREVPLRNRTPGASFEYGRLKLEQVPDARRQEDWQASWQGPLQCSWPPEDLCIEGFRDYVGRRALSLARVERSRSEPFRTSYLDGLDLRATLRDVVERRLHVREERALPGAVGALVIIFEEDDFGQKYPFRSTWMAEHPLESTLAFYATDFREQIVGPGVARAWYGGCLLIFPPVAIPDVWNDFRFERARTPSERLLLAGAFWCRDHFLVHVARRPPSPEVKRAAGRMRRHILHLPLSTFGPSTLERIRRMHVLNGVEVRAWARRFIR